ncbi:AP2-like ethylene-responsive transcription factor AIL7 [Zingiber officinale]|uniref:AP2-like ethylene-responsive transcription factor AIL7 n=1 Tax=Zingiber officinale TaxID=94328 RepID=UPI001C4B06C1|nr:AP2-like ethylene-responsive transcription factor AIL7 [Zingiber officinale]
MGHNWISFGLPPVEMLLRPQATAFDLVHSSNDDHDSYFQYFFPPAPAATDLKLEDLLTAEPCSDPLAQVTDAQDSSSAGTAVVEVSSPAAAGPLVPSAAGQRTSVYRGVTRHRWTGRYEAHLWDNTCRREGQKRKGRQVYLGGYDKEQKAAIAYDLAALKYWGPTATTNFPVSNYSKEIEEMKCMSKQEFIASIRRKSSGFSRGASIYRGVTRHHQHGRWQARIGRVAGNKDLYLGTFATEEEAAEAYDVAAIKFRGTNAVTNFELSRYDVEAIANTDLPIGATTKRAKLSLQMEQNQSPSDKFENGQQLDNVTPHLFGNHMQFQAPCGAAPGLTFCSLVENASVTVYQQDLCLFTAKEQLKNSMVSVCSQDLCLFTANSQQLRNQVDNQQ